MSKLRVSTHRTIILTVVSAYILFCGWCIFTAYAEFTWITRCMFGHGLCVRLFVEGDTRLDKVAILRVEIEPRGLQTSAEVRLELPAGIELVQNSPTWQQQFPLGKRSSHSVPIRVTQPGEWEIKAWVYATQYGGYGTDTIYIRSSATRSEVSDRPLPNNWQAPAKPMVVWQAAQRDDRLSGTLTCSGEPRLGHSLTVTYTVVAMESIPDASFVFLFPPLGFELVQVEFPEDARSMYKYSGQFSWISNLSSMQPMNFVATFRITDMGSGYVVGYIHTPNGALAQAIAHMKVNQFAGHVEFPTPVFLTPTPR